MESLPCVKHWAESSSIKMNDTTVYSRGSKSSHQGCFENSEEYAINLSEGNNESFTSNVYVKTKNYLGHTFFSPLKCNLESESCNNKAVKGGGTFLLVRFYPHQSVFNFYTMIEIFLPASFFTYGLFKASANVSVKLMEHLVLFPHAQVPLWMERVKMPVD